MIFTFLLGLSSKSSQWFEYFDSELVEAGPEPIKMSDGNYLFLYNSARRTNRSQPKPGWNLEYNLRWAILNDDNPTEVLVRSSEPLFSPELSWEKCDYSSNEWAQRGLTPFVVFVEGWKKIDQNRFYVWYQGCDTTTGVAELKVSFLEKSFGNVFRSFLGLIFILLFHSMIIEYYPTQKLNSSSHNFNFFTILKMSLESSDPLSISVR